MILEPQAVGDLVQLLAFALDARSADEGRSAFSKQGGGNKDRREGGRRARDAVLRSGPIRSS